MITLTLLTAFILLLFAGCKKEPIAPQLPPYTQEGKNIFACKIDGEVFIAKGVMDINTMSPNGILYSFYNDSTIKISAQEQKPIKGDFGINFRLHQGKWDYLLGHTENYAYVYLPVENYLLAESKFSTDSSYTGELKISYYKNEIIAGTFEFTAIDDRGEVIHVTDGRFDISTK